MRGSSFNKNKYLYSNQPIQNQIQIKKILLMYCFAVTILPIYTHAESTIDKLEKLRLVRNSFQYQRSLFKNMKFKAYYTQPYMEIEESQNGQPKFIEVPEKKTIWEHIYEINKDGKFLITTSKYQLDQNLQKMQQESNTKHISFNGELYYHYSQLGDSDSGEPGLGSIFTPAQPFDYSKAMVKPTFFMDHIFNDEIHKILDNPNHIQITITVKDKWRLEYKDPDSEMFYNLELDPEQDFMITRMSGYWTDSKTFEKIMQYGQTVEGLYYLKKGTLSIGGEEATIMEVQEFLLNGSEGDYTLEIPIGTRVTNYVKGFPEIYYQGQPGKTADESGDTSIYTVADRLNRFEEFEPDITLEDIGDAQLKSKQQTLSEPNFVQTQIEDETKFRQDPSLGAQENNKKSVLPTYMLVFIGTILMLVGGYFCVRWRG